MNPSSLASQIADYESGEMSDEAVVELFQYLIDTGIVWQLQGSYGRMAERLIVDGQCHLAKATHG